MKSFNIISFIFIFVIAFSNSFAQGGRWADSTPEERAEQQTSQMTEKLTLSDKQSEKIGEINLRYAKRMEEERKNVQDGDWQAMREKMIKLREEQNAEFKQFMTAAQFEEWQKIQAEQRNQRRERRGSRDDKPTDENKG